MRRKICGVSSEQVTQIFYFIFYSFFHHAAHSSCSQGLKVSELSNLISVLKYHLYMKKSPLSDRHLRGQNDQHGRGNSNHGLL